MESSCYSWLLMYFGLLFILLKGGQSLHINELKVPSVWNDSLSQVVLDCDYSLDDPNPVGLVVKWFHNDGDSPVYQWIPPKPPQDFGVLKGKVNLKYRASKEPNKMYRAIQIQKPTPDMSGFYKCFVSTFAQEAFSSKKMVIFVPQSKFLLTHTIEEDERENNNVEVRNDQQNLVNVTCSVEGVFPEPTVTILSASRPITKVEDVKPYLKNGLFNVDVSVQVDDDEIEIHGHTFECELNVPEVKYQMRKAIVVTLDKNKSTRRDASTLVLLVVFIFSMPCHYL